MSRKGWGQYKQPDPRSSENKVYPEPLNGVISWTIKGPAISVFPQQQQVSAPIWTPFTILGQFGKGVTTHRGSGALSWLQIKLCVITLVSYGKHMTVNCSTIGLCVYVYRAAASLAAWTAFLRTFMQNEPQFLNLSASSQSPCNSLKSVCMKTHLFTFQQTHCCQRLTAICANGGTLSCFTHSCMCVCVFEHAKWVSLHVLQLTERKVRSPRSIYNSQEHRVPHSPN